MSRRFASHGGAVAIALTLPLAAWAQTAALSKGYADVGQPDRTSALTTPAHIDGYGQTRFGMNEAEVRAAVTAEFGAQVAAGLHAVAEGPGRALLATTLPGSGPLKPPVASYVFNGGRLVEVTLNWSVEGQATSVDRAALVRTASELARGLYAFRWRLFGVTRGKPIGPNAVIVFSGEDALGNGCELALAGVDYTVLGDDGTRIPSPKATGPATLRLSYAYDIYHHNVLLKGAF